MKYIKQTWSGSYAKGFVNEEITRDQALEFLSNNELKELESQILNRFYYPSLNEAVQEIGFLTYIGVAR